MRVVCVLLVLSSSFSAFADEPTDSRLFRVDTAGKKILGPAKNVPSWLGLRFASVAMDQPQYWPDETVRVKIAMPGRPKAHVVIAWQKRDATPTTLERDLDEAGVAVVELLDGKKKKLELGEYRVTVTTADKALGDDATFSVVEGSLGAVSLAFEFKKVTSTDALEKEKGAWFLGNAARPGMRWGNGLSFKNELRVDNQPYTGEVQLATHCMLPGCNGVPAGPPKTVMVKNGLVAETMDVGGHSGPFQIEFILKAGTLRYQFEGSSHVERDMVECSLGMHHHHRAGLAPYEHTTQVPGRQIFVERVSTTEEGDAFDVERIVGAEVTLRARSEVQGATIVLWTPRDDGKFEPVTVPAGAKLASGDALVVKVPQPYGLLTAGGFRGGKLVEGFAIVFAPSAVKVAIEASKLGAPTAPLPVEVIVTSGGKPLQTSGVLEVFDNRVASRSPASPLSSAIGDSFRNASHSLTAWVDPIELARRLKEEEKREKDADKMMPSEDAPRPVMAPPPAPPAKMMKMGGRAGPMGNKNSGDSEPEDEEGEEGEAIREGQKKVVFCAAVTTDANGHVTVPVTLPPQTGRVTVRFVAVHGRDFGSEQANIDVAKKAYVEARLPSGFVPGAKLDVALIAVNSTDEPLTLAVTGAGVESTFTQTVAAGRSELSMPWTAKEGGTLSLTLADARGKVVDRRELPLHDVTGQPVTWSRLEFGAKPRLAAGETSVVFDGPGKLLRGTVANMVTTMASWFGHAEAVSAGVAARATILAAIKGGLIDDEGLGQTLRVDLDKGVRDLKAVFFDAGTGLIRPWPGLMPSPLWSAWVARNLHAAVRIMDDPALEEARESAKALAAAIDKSLKDKHLKGAELGGYEVDQEGLDVIPVLVDGQVVYKVLTDDAVQRFVADQLLPTLDPDQRNVELAFAKAYDTFRFLRAMERTGTLQYAIQGAKALWLAGPKRRAAFDQLFKTIARGMILAQEPGMIQGPALLGGVYSTPMALVRFLELMVLAGSGGPVARIDRTGRIALDDAGSEAFATVALSSGRLTVAEEATMTITLDAARDPLEYVALIAVPTTTSIKQTEDILDDYKGERLYGQMAMGGGKMQTLSVPFRGSRTLTLVLEGLYPGTSNGLVAIRHIENPASACSLRTGPVVVTRGE